MTRRTKIRTVHVTAATVALTAANIWTAYADSQSHRTDSGAWDGPLTTGWLLVILSALYLLVLGCYGLYRLVRTLFAAAPAGSWRPAPGEGRRATSWTPEEWVAYRNWHIANNVAGCTARVERTALSDDTLFMTFDALAEDDGVFPTLIDAVQAYGIAPTRIVRADAEAIVAVAEREYPEVSTVWTVEPESLRGQGAVLHAWFGDAFERRAA